MAALTIYINGQEVEAEEGSTILDAAKAAGIPIPTLCHHPALAEWGACRMCLVEIEPRGLLHPACTYPVSSGLRVQTHSEKVIRARKYVLQWLFSERNHYCMYCEASGECELQALAYEHELAHWLWARPNTPMPVDASRQYFVMDHNRCILCRRCVRACSEMSAVHTLSTGQRGAKTMVVADLDVPFGESSCISCGSCLQVCPTGALIDRHSAYMGRDEQLEATPSTCMGCSVGCGIVGRTRLGQLLRIEGDWGASVNKGLLCRLGRFAPLYVTAARLTTPMRRLEGRLQPCSWEEALGVVAEKMMAAEMDKGVAVLVSSRATNEELEAVHKSGNNRVLALYGGASVIEAPGPTCGLADVERAGAVVAIAADLDDEHEVVACLARRAFDNGARLYLLGGKTDRLAAWAEVTAGLDQAKDVACEVADITDVIVLYGPAATAESLMAFAHMANVRYLGLPLGVNTIAATAKGIGHLPGDDYGLLYVYAADDPAATVPAVQAEFVVAHACYRSPLTEVADVVLPALRWSEKEGHLTNLEGKELVVRRLVPAPATLRDDREVFAALTERQAQRVR
ncbi:MAG: molybdopterin-dependent oxidoreductase [Anaerolineae bacterium]